jgi:hypothetical protein
MKCYEGREMPSFCILDWRVVRFMPSLAAAPACTVKSSELVAEILTVLDASAGDPFYPA